jgi:hypothetical protein
MTEDENVERTFLTSSNVLPTTGGLFQDPSVSIASRVLPKFQPGLIAVKNSWAVIALNGAEEGQVTPVPFCAETLRKSAANRAAVLRIRLMLSDRYAAYSLSHYHSLGAIAKYTCHEMTPSRSRSSGTSPIDPSKVANAPANRFLPRHLIRSEACVLSILQD